MATLTVSTTGFSFRMGECHKVEDISHSRFTGDENRREVVALTLDVDQALGIAYDLLYQAVDAGAISGWNVQFPEGSPVVSIESAGV